MSKGLLFLLVFTPLAFGTVEPWSIAIMEIVAFGFFFLQTASKGVAIPSRWPDRAVLILFLLLVGLVLLQVLPLSDGILSLLSPAAIDIWRRFGSAPPGTLRTVSLYPDATRQELLKLLAYAAVFVVVVREVHTRAQVRFLVRAILYIGGFLALFAIVQKLAWNGRIFWVFPVAEAQRSGAGIWGPFINRNHFAGYLELAIPLGLGLLMSVARETANLRGASWSRRMGRFLASDGFAPSVGIFLLVLLMSACLVSTRSRGGIAAWVVSSLFFAWITWRKRALRSRALLPLLMAVAAGAAVLLPSWESIEQRFEDIDEKEQLSRLYVLNDSLGIVEAFPLLGTGLGTFGQAYRRFQTKDPRLFYDHAHNDYLEMATDTGAAGLLLAAGMAAVFFLALIRRWRRKRSRFGTCIGAGGLSSCLAIAVHSGTDFNLHIPANALLFAAIAGLTYAAVFNVSEGAGSRGVPDTAAPPHRSPARKLLVNLGAVSLAGLLLYLPARNLLADYHYQQVERILDDKGTPALDVKPIAAGTINSYAGAIASLKRAAALEPGRSAYPQALAGIYTRLGTWASAMESVQIPLPAGAPPAKEARSLAMKAAQWAVMLEPTNPEPHLALGQLYAAEDGNLARAGTQIRLALEAHPSNVPLRYSAATLYLLSGSKGDALEQARALARLDDSYTILESPAKTFMIERRSRGYLARLRNSYLFQAFEIAWRASGDIDLVRSIAPPSADAKAVLDLFLEWKGFEE